MFFVFITLNAWSQNPNFSNQKIEQHLSDYYELDRENIHLHLNKTVFLSNETIWFKGYIIEKKESKLNFQTTNVYVRLLNEYKQELVNQLFYATNGSVLGQLKINETFPSGNYYLHVYTNYMNNFEEDESTIQPIKIINTGDQIESILQTESKELNLQVAFEGGTFLAKSDNIIGVNIKDCYGRGVKLTNIEVKNSKGIVVNTFATNQEGYGKFSLTNTKFENFTININNNGNLITKNIGFPSAEGINIQLNNYAIDGKTTATILTNEETLKKIKNKNFTILIQKNNEANSINFTLDNVKKEFLIDNADFFSGINTIRLINDELTSVSERVIYYHTNNTIHNIKTVKTKDSLKISGSLNNLVGNFSASILPKNTLSNFNENAIVNTLIFKNYLNIGLQNPDYYFKKFNNRKAFELDLFLLHTSDTKYKWSKIVTTKPIEKYTFDIGINVDGKINQVINNRENVKLKLFSINGLNEFSNINDKNEFEFKNLLVIDSSSIHFSLLKKDDKLQSLNIYSRVTNNNKPFLKQIKIDTIDCKPYVFNKITNNNNGYPKIAGAINLKQVDISREATKPKLTRERQFNNNMARGYKISDTDAGSFRDVLSFISSHGYDVSTEGANVVIRSRVAKSILGTRSPAVFLDNVPVYDFGQLLNLSLNEIDEIYINKSSFGMGNDGGNGSIRIYRKSNFSGGIKANEVKSKSLIIKNGFQPLKKYENPKYIDYYDNSFLTYGSIDWISNIYTDEKGYFEFTIPHFDQDTILINIQGIDNLGQLYNENIELEVK